MARLTDPMHKHRRDVWLQMVLPLVGVGLVLVLLVVGLFTLAVAGTYTAEQIETMAGVMMIVCILLPLAIIMLLLNAAVLALAVGTGKVPAMLLPILEMIRKQTEGVMQQVSKYTTRFAQPIITIDSRWTRWEQAVRSFFEPPKPKTQTKESTTHESE